MELEFTPEQDELRDSVRTVLAHECPLSLVRKVVEKGASTDALWAQMVALGWPALTIAEELGGLGLGSVELAVVVEELGRAVTPGPLLPTITQFAPAVAETGSPEQQARFLGAVARGAIAGSLAVAEPSGSYDPAMVQAVAEPDADGFVLHGAKHFVFEPARVDEIIVVARLPGTTGDDGIGAFAVPCDKVEIEPLAALDASRQLGAVDPAGVRIERDRVLGEPGAVTAAALRRAIETATVALAIEIVGTCQAIFDLTLDYAKQREQFGVPIGSFQAIKHKFADMLLTLERARATAYFAALTIAEDEPRRAIATSMAKAAAGDCAALLTKEGIQIHGGIGYTWEYDLHLYVRRAKSAAGLFGTATHHRARVADLIEW